jgi:drug/metabolite transporter (DMT)-like permease
MEKTQMKIRGHVGLSIAALIWGLNAPIGKEAMRYVSALSLSTFRMAGAAAAFLLLSLFLKREPVSRRDNLRLVAASLLGVAINQGLFIQGLSYTSPVNAAIMTTTLPIITMLLAAWLLREPMTGKKILGVALGATGAVILITSGGGFTLTGGVKGDLMCLCAQVSVAFYLTLFKDLFVRYSPFTVLTRMFTYSAIAFLPLSWGDVTTIPYASLPGIAWAEIAFVVFGATFLAYIGFMLGQKYLRPTVVSMYNYLQPIVAALVAVWAGMDSFGPRKCLAVALVFAGVYLVTMSKSREQLDASAK